MKYVLFSLKRNIHLLCLVQLIKQSILRILNFNFSNLRCCKVFLSFLRKELYWHFRVYCGNNLKLLPGKNTQQDIWQVLLNSYLSLWICIILFILNKTYFSQKMRALLLFLVFRLITWFFSLLKLFYKFGLISESFSWLKSKKRCQIFILSTLRRCSEQWFSTFFADLIQCKNEVSKK